MMGDNEHTFIPSCHAHLEAEANFAAGRLLFLRDRFAEECLAQNPSFNALKEIKKTYGNTHTTTVWRGVETWGNEMPIIVLITEHPSRTRRSANFNSKEPCKHFIRSSAFAEKFSSVRETDVFDQIVGYCRGNKAGPLGEADVPLTDGNGEGHVFRRLFVPLSNVDAWRLPGTAQPPNLSLLTRV